MRIKPDLINHNSRYVLNILTSHISSNVFSLIFFCVPSSFSLFLPACLFFLLFSIKFYLSLSLSLPLSLSPLILYSLRQGCWYELQCTSPQLYGYTNTLAWPHDEGAWPFLLVHPALLQNIDRSEIIEVAVKHLWAVLNSLYWLSIHIYTLQGQSCEWNV